jgi:hypothetical protein
MSQTVINAGGQAIGDAGDTADSGPMDVVSGFNQNTAQLPFGFGVRDGTARDFYVLPTGMSNAYPVGGVFLRRANYQPQITLPNGQTVGDLGASGVVQNAPLNIARKGRVLVPVEAAVTLGQRAWCRGVATGAQTQGSWRGADVGAVPLGGSVALGASYFIDCTRAGVFRSASFTAADGSTLVAVLESDFTVGVV